MEIFRNFYRNFYRETIKMNDNTLHVYANRYIKQLLKTQLPPNKHTPKQTYAQTFIRINDFEF